MITAFVLLCLFIYVNGMSPFWALLGIAAVLFDAAWRSWHIKKFVSEGVGLKNDADALRKELENYQQMHKGRH